MTATHASSPQGFCWMDLKTHDPQGTANFFARTLGWRFAVDEGDGCEATKISIEGHQIGGVSDLSNPYRSVHGPELCWTKYSEDHEHADAEVWIAVERETE